MIKGLLKLAVVALFANALWHVFVPYAAHYKFTDAIEQTTQFGDDRSEEALRAKVLELAAQYDVPLTEDGFTVRRENAHTIVDGAYKQPIDILPGYTYPYAFTFHTDTFTQRSPVDSRAPK